MNAGFLLILVVLFVVMWLLVIRPQKRRQREQQAMIDSLVPGAEILTAGGLFGRVRAVTDDEVRLEIAPQVEVRVAKRAVAAVLPSDEEAPQVLAGGRTKVGRRG